MKLLNDLNTQQKEAVVHKGGPLLIVAGAGTGKTTVITRRVAWLIDQGLAKPEEILALTFTDKAATEMEERVDQLLPMGYVNTWISTFHAFGDRILKDYALEIGLPNDFRLLSASEQWMLVRNNLDKFDLNYYRPLGNPSRFIHALIQHFSRAKDEIVEPKEYLEYVQGLQLNTDSDTLDAGELERLQEVANAYHTYQQLLLENNAFDFGDLINYTLKLLRERPRVLKELREKFKYVLVDEFQDTNYAQYELLKLLAAPDNNVTVVGDDDQSVYAFRGTSMSNILNFKNDYPHAREVVLTQNYRSFQDILDVSYKFIQLNNPNRLEVKLNTQKRLESTRQGEGIVEYTAYQNAQDEAQGVIKKIIELHNQGASWSDFAVLVRANSSAPIFIKALQQNQIPFDYVANKGLYRESIVVEVLNYLRLLDNHQDSNALYRVLTTEPFVLPHEDIVKIVGYSKQKAISLFETLKNIDLSVDGLEIIAKLQKTLEQHAAMTREHSAAEVYVQVVRDLGLEERVAHPALVQDAQNLAALYDRIKNFELDTDDHSVHSFLAYLDLELQSGEQGRLPSNFEEGPDTVKIITVHSAKGLEWPYVFIVHLIDKRFPSIGRREPIELPVELIKEVLPEGNVHLQEERRLFYVAMTRARDNLYLSRAGDYFGKQTRKPSRFLYETDFVDEDEIKAKPASLAVSAPVAKTVSKAHYPLPPSFSFSSVSAFRKCPLEYKFRYLLRLPAPGSAYLSFGSTIHKTLEQFLMLCQARQRSQQGDLFGKSKVEMPTLDELKQIYEKQWIDDWYADANQKNEFRTIKGPHQLKNFYEQFSSTPPRPKYLEKFFKIAMGPHKFVGKIDRMDEIEGGCKIIDYKTGDTSPARLVKVDKDQLIVYQIAAEEFLKEHIIGASYWYLQPNQFSESFVAQEKDKEKLKDEYIEIINTIIQTIKTDSFLQADIAAPQHECKYR